jgi:hypothetical protein
VPVALPPPAWPPLPAPPVLPPVEAPPVPAPAWPPMPVSPVPAMSPWPPLPLIPSLPPPQSAARDRRASKEKAKETMPESGRREWRTAANLSPIASLGTELPAASYT